MATGSQQGRTHAGWDLHPERSVRRSRPHGAPVDNTAAQEEPDPAHPTDPATAGHTNPPGPPPKLDVDDPSKEPVGARATVDSHVRATGPCGQLSITTYVTAVISGQLPVAT